MEVREFRQFAKYMIDSHTFSLSIDGFNPYTNKQAGISASVGSMSMACLSLPPSLRHRAENHFLGGLIPDEPKLDEINHYMSPFVQDLLTSWIQGNW